MEGGSEPQLTGTFRIDPADPVNPLACSKIVAFAVRLVTFGPGRRSRVMFFDFFSDSHVQNAYF